MASSVTVKLGVTGLDSFKKDMETAENTAGLLNQVSLKNFTDALGGIEAAAKRVITSIANIGKGLWQGVVDSSKWADDLLTTSQQYGISLKELQQWQLASELIDVDMNTVLTAQDKIVQNLAKSNKAATDAWEVLGVKTKDASGKTRDATTVFWESIDALGKVKDETEKDELAMLLFGKNFRDLSTLVDAGSQKWKEAGAGAQILSDEDVVRLGQANDAYQELTQSWEATKLQLFADLAPAFTTIAESLTTLSQAVGEWLATDEGRAAIESFGNAIASMITSVTDVDTSKIFETIKGAIDGLVSAFTWIAENGETVAKIIGGIAVAFEAIKIGAEVLKFVEALKGLGGAKGVSDAVSALNNASVGGVGGAGGIGTATGAAGGTTLTGAIATAAGDLAVYGPFAAAAVTMVAVYKAQLATEEEVGRQQTEKYNEIKTSINNVRDVAQAQLDELTMLPGYTAEQIVAAEKAWQEAKASGNLPGPTPVSEETAAEFEANRQKMEELKETIALADRIDETEKVLNDKLKLKDQGKYRFQYVEDDEDLLRVTSTENARAIGIVDEDYLTARAELERGDSPYSLDYIAQWEQRLIKQSLDNGAQLNEGSILNKNRIAGAVDAAIREGGADVTENIMRSVFDILSEGASQEEYDDKFFEWWDIAKFFSAFTNYGETSIGNSNAVFDLIDLAQQLADMEGMELGDVLDDFLDIALDSDGEMRDSLLSIGQQLKESLGYSSLEGLISMEDEASEVGVSFASAILSGVMQYAADAAGIGSYAIPTINVGGGRGTYMGSNLYVGTMNMSGGTDAEYLLNLINQNNSRQSAGYGGR